MPFSHTDYTVACICPMGDELSPVLAMLDKRHPSLVFQDTHNNYELGEMHGHNVVIAILPGTGSTFAAITATRLLNDFPCIRFGSLVGIGGGVPDDSGVKYDIRLGDVAISKPTGILPGVVQYDLGKHTSTNGFERTGTLSKPPQILLSSLEKLYSKHETEGSLVPFYLATMLEQYPKMARFSHPGVEHDQLFDADYIHAGGSDCNRCDKQKLCLRGRRDDMNPRFHYGTIRSANAVVKETGLRRALSSSQGIICLEMEAAGLMDILPCVVIRGISDYSDSHKNDVWRRYAADTSSAYLKELLSVISPRDISNLRPATLPRYNEPAGAGVGRASYSSIIWIDASSELSINTSLRRIAFSMMFEDNIKNLDDEQVYTKFSAWLSQTGNSHWLWVLDGYDTPDHFKIEKYYPFASHGSIIITSRYPNLINGYHISVGPINNGKDCLKILATRSERAGIYSDRSAYELVARLDGLPLALATAGSFLKHSVISYASYLSRYEAKGQVLPSYLSEPPEYRNGTLFTTWDISLASIEEKSPNATNLLALLAYFDHHDIWFGLIALIRSRHIPEWFARLTKDEFVFEERMLVFHRYGLMQSCRRTSSYSIHACVHDWALNGLNLHEDNELYWLAFDCVASQLSADQKDDFSSLKYRRIVPHAVRLAQERFLVSKDADKGLRERLVEITLVGTLLFMQVQYESAERIWLHVLAAQGATLGAKHLETITTIRRLGLLYRHAGRLSQAEGMFHKALVARETDLGPQHPLTLQLVKDCGDLYRDQGKLVHAENMYERALFGQELMFGETHAITVCTIHSLGNLYSTQRRFDESSKMLQRALGVYEQTKGKENITTLNVVNDLGNLNYYRGHIEEAKSLYERALHGRKQTLGEEHPSTLETMSNLATLFRDIRKLHESEELFQKALAGKHKALGAKHISTLNTTNSLANLYELQKRYTEAELLFQQALSGFEQTLGQDNIQKLDTVNNLGIYYYNQDKLCESELMYKRALTGKKRSIGHNHPSTLSKFFNLGLLYQKMKKYDESAKIYEQVACDIQAALGSDHLSTLTVLNGFAKLCYDRGKFSEAKLLYQRALDGRGRKLGYDHPLTQDAKSGLMKVSEKLCTLAKI